MTDTVKLFIFDNGGTMRVGENVLVKHFASLGYNFTDFASLGSNAAKARNEINLGLIDEKQFWKEVDKDLVKPTGYETFLYDTKISYPITGMEDIVHDLKKNGYRVVVGTNIGASEWLRNIADGNYDCFDARYSSCDLHVCKPDSLFYKKIAEAECTELSDIMLIDDQKDNVESALRIGMKALLFRNSFTLRDELTALGYIDCKKSF